MSALRKAGLQHDDAQLVYQGRDAAGAISQRGREWLALDIDGRRIGRFATRLEAFAAVLKAGRGQ